MRRKIIRDVAIVLAIAFAISGWVLLAYGKENITPVGSGEKQLIRLHVLANSDSTQDQAVKLKVRDAIIEYMAPYLRDVNDASAARQIVLSHRDALESISNQVLTENGLNYPVQIEIGYFDFPVKSYGNLTLPAGKYEAVRVLIGSAAGKNWWCVLFPPLCFIDVTNAAAMPISSGDSKAAGQKSDIEYKWKIAELWSEMNYK